MKNQGICHNILDLLSNGLYKCDSSTTAARHAQSCQFEEKIRALTWVLTSRAEDTTAEALFVLEVESWTLKVGGIEVSCCCHSMARPIPDLQFVFVYSTKPAERNQSRGQLGVVCGRVFSALYLLI